MDSGSLTQLSQTSAGAQMRLLEIAQILIISTLVLFAAALVIIVCLCLGDVGQPRLEPSVQVAVGETDAIPPSTTPHAGNSGIYSSPRAFFGWVRHLGSTSVSPFPMTSQSGQLGRRRSDRTLPAYYGRE
jgi:hypothetical protein